MLQVERLGPWCTNKTCIITAHTPNDLIIDRSST
jgi:hypothetical protein